MTKIIKGLYLVLFFFTPLIFTSFNSELFELPKMYFVYLVSLPIILIHLYLYWTKQSPLSRPTFLTIPLLLFLLSQIISTLISIDRYTSFFGYYSRLNGGLLPTTTYIGLYFVLLVYLDSPLAKKIIGVSLLSGLIVAVFGILEHFGIDKSLWVQDVQNRVFATFGQPNWLAAYLCLLLPFSLHSFLFPVSSRHRWLSALLSTIFLICLIFTKSQSGLLAAATLTTVTTFVYFLRSADSLLLRLTRSFAVVIFTALLVLTINNPLKDKLFSRLNPNLPVATVPNPTIIITPSQDIRKIVWQGTLDLWKRYPLFGTGVESFAYSYYWTRPASHNLTSEWDFLYNKAHNEFLNYLATTGVFGLSTYLLFILLTLAYSLRQSLQQPSGYGLPVLAGLIGSLVINFAGFSVVISSIYLFLLPALLSLTPSIIHPRFTFSPLKILLVGALLFSLEKTLIRYYLADILYTQSQSLEDSQNQYLKAYAAVDLALDYRPNEPLYLVRRADLASKIAIYYVEKFDPLNTDRFAKIALADSYAALSSHPYDINLAKQTAQVYLYLATADPQFYQSAIQTLQLASQNAPTDAKLFYILGKVSDLAGQKSQSLDYYLQAVNLKPNYDHALYELASYYYQHQQYPKAKQYFQQVLQYAPNNTDAQKYLQQLSSLTPAP
jgi:putative inorganic carbon (HCO3(-)) transporter